MRKVVVRVLFVVACVGTLIGAFYVIESIRGERAWSRYKDQAEKRGQKLYLSDYLPSNPPDAENFAAIPLFRELFTAAQNHQPHASPFALPGGTPPKLSDHAVARRLDLAEWQHFFNAAAASENNANDAPAALLAALGRYAAADAELRDAASRPRSRFPVRWEDGFSAVLPHLAVLRDAARINALRMEAHVTQGNSAAAYDDFRFGLRLAQALQEEPLLLCGIVRVAMLQTLGNAVWDGLAMNAWDDEALRRIMADLSQVQPLRDWEFAIKSEQGAMNSVLDDLAVADGAQRAKIFGNASNPVSGEAFVWRLLPTGWLRQNQVWLNEYSDDMLRRIDVQGQRYHDTPSRELPDALHAFPRRLYYIVACLIAPAYDRIHRSFLAMHTFIQEVRTACALERFRHARNQYPPSLDSLVPDFLETVPRDVIDGKPLRFRVRDDGRYLLYSIAQNGKDDGGAMSAQPNDERLDWVWQYPAAELPAAR